MLAVDVKNIYLTSGELRLLKRIKKAPIMLNGHGELPKKYAPLLDKGLIGDPSFVVQVGGAYNSQASTSTFLKYSITNLGIEHLLYRKEKFADVRLPFIISTALALLALAVSVIAIIVSVS